jgi:hypothetical protein
LPAAGFRDNHVDGPGTNYVETVARITLVENHVAGGMEVFLEIGHEAGQVNRA